MRKTSLNPGTYIAMIWNDDFGRTFDVGDNVAGTPVQRGRKPPGSLEGNKPLLRGFNKKSGLINT